MQKYWVTVEDCGTIHWYKDAKMTIRHRVGGPAIEWSDGRKEWWLDGKQVTQEQHKKLTAPQVEEMTMAQLEAALGKKIKIIK